MKNTKYHTDRTLPKSNRKIEEIGKIDKIDTHNTQLLTSLDVFSLTKYLDQTIGGYHLLVAFMRIVRVSINVRYTYRNTYILN